MADITPFPGFALPPGHIPAQPEVIELLEELLDDARSGKLSGIAYAAVDNGAKQLKTGWRGDVSRELQGYAVTRLHHEFFAAACADGG